MSKARRRMVVAFVEAESDQHRMVRQVMTGDWEVERGRAVLLRYDGVGEEYSARYWCAADRPDADGVSFAVKPVYRTHEVPGDASCEVCGISIRELQAAMGTLGR